MAFEKPESASSASLLNSFRNRTRNKFWLIAGLVLIAVYLFQFGRTTRVPSAQRNVPPTASPSSKSLPSILSNENAPPIITSATPSPEVDTATVIAPEVSPPIASNSPYGQEALPPLNANGSPTSNIGTGSLRSIEQLDYFTIGSTRDVVMSIQGEPDSFSERRLRYGTSEVYLENGRVTGWANYYPKLKVRLLPRHASTDSYFTIASTKDDVLSIQGTPDRFSENAFHYGTSTVHFQNERVVSWENYYPKLKAQLSPAVRSNRVYFTVGSTRDDVLSIQGTPDRFSENAFHYGTSTVHFQDGRVVSWENYYPKLKAQLSQR